MMNFLRRLIILLLFVAPSSMAVIHAQDLDLYDSPVVVDLDPHYAVAWMELMYRRIEAQAISAPAASRMYAYGGITLYEALLNGMPDSYSLSGQLPGNMPQMPLPDQSQLIDWLSVANAAMATVMPELFAAPSQETLDTIQALSDEQAEARRAEVGEEVVTHSMEYGQEIGRELIEWIIEDNFKVTRGRPYEVPTGAPWLWVPTVAEQQSIEPYWGEIRPFTMDYADQCAVALDVPFDTDENSTFYLQAMEVKNTGDNLTPWQQETARYWVDTPGQTGTPAGHWISIANQLVDELNLPLDRTAHMYALLGMAVGDSFISAWSLKYQENLVRPETYIQTYIQRTWGPYIATPNFPEYPSGHSVVSGAAAEILTWMFGARAFADHTHIIYEHERLQRSFTTFWAAANEAGISRLYGGIHYRTAIENGLDQGRCIARNMAATIRLRSLPQGE